MKKTGILNSRISAVVAQMGHKDTLLLGMLVCQSQWALKRLI